MSDTPRTDEAQFGTGRVSVDFARTLERELNAANAEIDRLTAKVAQLYEGAEEQRQRIKQLEEAGDRIIEAGWSVQDWSGMCVVWAKAKEAKP